MAMRVLLTLLSIRQVALELELVSELVLPFLLEGITSGTLPRHVKHPLQLPLQDLQGLP